MKVEEAKAQLEVLKATMLLDGASYAAEALEVGMMALDVCAKMPKEHGRLVDAEIVYKNLIQYFDRSKTLKQCVDEAPTIIEANWEENEWKLW